MNPKKFSLIALLCLLCGWTSHAEITVRAYFDPPEIALGDQARYIVEITENDTESMPDTERVTSLPIPETSGLTLRNGRTSSTQQTRIVNSEKTFTTIQTLAVDAVPSATGNYTIPGYQLEYKGNAYPVPVSSLNVLERGADAGPTINELIFLKLDAPETLYLGQTIETHLKLYVSSEARLRGLHDFQKQADGFTSSQLPDDSTESSEIVNGYRYRVISWPIQLTPIRSGMQDLSFQFTLSAQLPNRDSRQNQNRGFNSPFGSSIFDDFFNQTTEQFTVFTDPMQIDVQALPLANQPASFSGAIGDFNLQVFADSESTSVDEPIMLSLKLSGTGNFDRINGPEFPDSAQWRHYKPETSFEAKDASGTRGTKRFDYVFIPQEAGPLKLPEVKFAFFDPETEEYVELASPAIEVEVKPSLRPRVAPQSAPKTTDTSSSLTTPSPTTDLPAVSQKERLLTLDYQPNPGKQIDSNPLNSIWFWAVNLVIAASAIGYLLYRKRIRSRDPVEHARVTAAKSDCKASMKAAEEALAQNSVADFYHAAERAIRAKLSAQSKRSYYAASSNEIVSALESASLSSEQMARIQSILSTNNALRFSGQKHATESMAKCKNMHSQLIQIIKQL